MSKQKVTIERGANVLSDEDCAGKSGERKFDVDKMLTIPERE